MTKARSIRQMVLDYKPGMKDKDGKKIPGSIEISTDQIFIDPDKIKDIFIINTNMTPLVPIDLNSFKSICSYLL